MINIDNRGLTALYEIIHTTAETFVEAKDLHTGNFDALGKLCGHFYSYIGADNAYKSLMTTHQILWKWLATANPPKDKGFMFWSHPNVQALSNLVVDNNGQCGKSEASMELTMRNLQYVARHGWNSLVNFSLENLGIIDEPLLDNLSRVKQVFDGMKDFFLKKLQG